MFRYLIAHLPTFRLDRCGVDPQDQAILVAEQQSALRVQSATPRALRQGVRTGMTAAQATALAPDLLVERLDPAAELADLNELATQLLRVSPAVAALPCDALVAEIGRSDHAGPRGRQAGAERAMVERVRIRLERLGHQAHVVVADDPATALAVATWGRRCRVIGAGQGAAALAPLPLAALELPAGEYALLDGLGIRTVGDFAALPPSAVSGRLGPVARAAHALARGLGSTPRIAVWQDGGVLTLRQALPDPVAQLDALIFVINGLLRDAAARLTAAGQAVSRLVLCFDLDAADGQGDSSDSSGGSQRLSVRLGDPTRDPRRILQVLRLRLERLRLAGPVIGLSIELPELAPFDGRQNDLQGRHRTGEALAEVAGRLQDTLGAGAVIRPLLANRHRPEAEWTAAPSATAGLPGAPTAGGQARLPLTAGAMHPADALARSRADHSDPVREWQGFPTLLAPERPPLLLSPPQAVDVRVDQDGAPRMVAVDGRPVDVVGRLGPEQLSGEWWEQSFDRAYWRVLLRDGRRAWLYQEDERWALHGWWDR